MLGKQRGFLSRQGETPARCEPHTHAFSPGCVAKGAGLGTDGRRRRRTNKDRWLFIP